MSSGMNKIGQGSWEQERLGVRRNFQRIASTVLGPESTPIFAGLTLTGLTANALIYPDTNKLLTSATYLTTSGTTLDIAGKVTVGSQTSPQDVTATRQYGLELHYSGNNYNVTGIRNRAQLVTTDASTKTALGGLFQAANNDGIDAGVLMGFMAEAIGKSTSNASTITTMRGGLIGTEWGALDTVTNLKTLHIRGHSRNAAGAGSFGTGYALYIENEAVGGNGQAYDAGIYFKGTNLSAGNKAFTYGIDFSGGTYGTAEILFKDGTILDSRNIAGGLYGINVEILTGDKTLTSETDEMYQYLDEGGEHRNITLNTASATAGDRFVIRHNGVYDDSHFLIIKQGATELDELYAGAIKKFIFDGTNWIAVSIGTAEDSSKHTNIAIGGKAKSYLRGVSVGFDASGYNKGVAIGYVVRGYTFGIAIGEGSAGYNYGVAIGADTRGMRKGVAVGYQAGCNIDTTADRGNILLGYQAGDNITIGTYNVLLGYDIDTPAVDTDNFMSLGNIIFATGVDGTGTIVSSGNVGIAEPDPETILEITHAQPYITLHNSTHEDTDGGGEVRIIGKREDGAGTETAAGQIEISHDGSGANDQLGKIVEYVNTGAGLVAARAIKSTTDWVINKTSGVGIKVDLAAPTFGWRDLKGKITNSKGATKPSEITYREGITQFQFGAGDDAGLEYHIPHDYVPGTDIHLHVHWSHISGAVTGGNVIFTYEITYCKGHNQAAFPATVTGTITGTASSTQYKHIISEGQISISTGSGTQIDTDDLEPDGLILCRIEMTTNNMTGATPDPFIHEVDVHYQSTNLATKQKAPNFYI